jgi:hypothetical protein
LSSILLTLSYCALLRIPSIEKISDEPPGELGKAIGLDRIPEIKTLREKLDNLSVNNQAEEWGGEISKGFMNSDQDLAGVLYIDGHQNVSYSKKNKLPRNYVCRLRLAMRSTADYWICDKIGQPFFSINKTINTGLISVIKEDIIPVLLKDVPNQPDEEALKNDPFLHRFMIVYDREGYSNDFMLDMWEQKIACCTYNKYVKDVWSEEEFEEHEIVDEYGEKTKVLLAERGILINGEETEKLEEPIEVYKINQTEDGLKVKTGKKHVTPKRQMWIREVRKLRDDGRQTSIITTNFKLKMALIGFYMFARWCQENFFKYMIKYYGLDMIASYLHVNISDTQLVRNPEYRDLKKRINSLTNIANRKEAKLGSLHYETEIDEKKIKKYVEKKSQLLDEISTYKDELIELKEKLKTMKPKICYSELSEDEKFKSVYNQRKKLLDTIKIIAARSEISLAQTIKPYMAKPKDARAMIEQFLKTNADFEVDNEKKILRVLLHHQPTRREDEILKELCKELNETETIFPGTNLTLKYGFV